MPEYRSIQGEIRLLESENEFLFPIEIWAYNDRLTRNGWRFTNMEQHREKWAGIPVLCAYVNGGTKVGSGHNQSSKLDKNGEPYQSFTAADAERIVGATSENEEDIRIESEADNKWLVAKATLYRWYARELTDKIIDKAVQGGVMDVSIEALVTESHMEGDVEVEDAYLPLGITVLGDGVAPAVPGAHVAMLSEMESEFKELKLRAASYQNSAEENKPKNNPKEGVKKRMRLSKTQLREMESKFDSYKVLAAEQYDDNSVRVCLLSANGGTAAYTMASLDESVVLDRVESINAQVHFCAEEGKEDICVDASDMTDCVAAEMKECKDRAETAEKDLKECKETMQKMVETENARRLFAAKKTATDTLAEFNANREEKVDAKCLEALDKDIEAGKFTACEDDNHAWCGDALVKEKVLSICAMQDMELQKKLAASRNEPKAMTWGGVKQASANPGTIGELFASKN